MFSGVCWGCSEGGFGGFFMGPDLRKSESSKPPAGSPAPSTRPREEANVATSDLSASMSFPLPSPAEGFFDFFLVRFDLGFGSAMGRCGGSVAAGARAAGAWQAGARAGLGKTKGEEEERTGGGGGAHTQRRVLMGWMG